jgi:hypothetical protein
MKIVWIIVTLLLLAGLIVVFQPQSSSERQVSAEQFEAQAASVFETPVVAPLVAPVVAPEITPAIIPTPVQPPAAINVPTVLPVIEPPTGIVDLAAKTPAQDPDASAAEPPAATATMISAGTEFTPDIPSIAQAEILPSKFIRLTDGSISVDDAWTIRGEGTREAPYEVSWEFLASAQETYTPRLGEKKIPARIAFLSGKHVRIAGYLAFPLVAPTASECLVMLNQWDGCCIGVPPSPYDAIEVKLEKERKGWRRHSINFGAIDGVFKVEPYLIENWLVGLYLFEAASIDEEL